MMISEGLLAFLKWLAPTLLIALLLYVRSRRKEKEDETSEHETHETAEANERSSHKVSLIVSVIFAIICIVLMGSIVIFTSPLGTGGSAVGAWILIGTATALSVVAIHGIRDYLKRK